MLQYCSFTKVEVSADSSSAGLGALPASTTGSSQESAHTTLTTKYAKEILVTEPIRVSRSKHYHFRPLLIVH